MRCIGEQISGTLPHEAVPAGPGRLDGTVQSWRLPKKPAVQSGRAQSQMLLGAGAAAQRTRCVQVNILIAVHQNISKRVEN